MKTHTRSVRAVLKKKSETKLSVLSSLLFYYISQLCLKIQQGLLSGPQYFTGFDNIKGLSYSWLKKI